MFGVSAVLLASSVLLLSAAAASSAQQSTQAPFHGAQPWWANVPEAGYRMDDPQFRLLYGPGVLLIDSLANLDVGVTGGKTRIVSQRFRATASGHVSSLTPYWAGGPGYAAGTGGTISVRIVPDDGTERHHPDLSAQPLASGRYQARMSGGRHIASRFNDPVTMRSAAPLVDGRLYHAIYQNVDDDPAANYLGVNCAATLAEHGRPSRWLGTPDWAALSGVVPAPNAAPEWHDLAASPGDGRARYAPILQIALDDGTVFGNTTMETGNTESRHWLARASRPLRERFKPGTSRTIIGFSIHAAAVDQGALDWQLRRGDQSLARGRIEAGARRYRVSHAFGRVSGVFDWFDVDLGEAIRFDAGGTYDLQFTPVGESLWRFADQRNGSAKGYRWPAAFSESQAQVWYTGFWHDFNHWLPLLSTRGSNWRIVLHQAP